MYCDIIMVQDKLELCDQIRVSNLMGGNPIRQGLANQR